MPLVKLCTVPGSFLCNGCFYIGGYTPAEQDVCKRQDVKGMAQAVARFPHAESGWNALKILGRENRHFYHTPGRSLYFTLWV